MKNERPLSSAFTRRDLFRYTGLLGAAAGITATLAACGGGPSSTSVVGGSASTGDLTTAIGYGNDQSFDPMQTASGFLMAAVNHVYEGLLENDPGTGETYAALAQAVPTDATASSWTMKIREGATWHDGTPVTSDDVVFTFDRILDPQQNVLIRSFFSSWLQSVTKVDDQTVTLNFNYPFSAAAQRLSIAKIMPKHVFDGHWDEAKSGALVVGSGPYKLKSHTPKSNTAFEAFEAYNGPRPANFATMNWLSIVDTSSRIARVSGNNAGAQLADNIPVANVPTLTSGGRTVEGNPGMNLMYLLFDTTQAPFDDVRVRQAMFYAINTPKMIEIALGGKA
ncbi:ABC transporter substrate-binding protein, partial [Rhodococcus erythropolis]|nr:ABC transporter substrate-binding protein [Rhodococcus erythropolis]